MEHYETYETILEVLLIIIVVVLTAFPLWYGFGNKFWTTRAGLATLFMSSGLALAWDLTAYLHFFPPDVDNIALYFWLQFTIMVITIIAGVYLLYALWYNRRHGTMATVSNVAKEPDDERS